MKTLCYLILVKILFCSSSNAQNKPLLTKELLKTEYNCLRIHLMKDSSESDEAVVRFMDGKSDAFTPGEDIVKPLLNPGVNISSFFSPSTYCMVNYLNTNSMKSIKVPLAAWVDEAGIYALNFDQTKDFDSNIIIQLKDNYNNSITDLRVNSSYSFNVDEKIESTADGRLELWFSSKTNAIENHLFHKHQINVYPNPVANKLNIDMTNIYSGNFAIKIYNDLGLEIENQEYNINETINEINTSNFKEGIYFIKIFRNGDDLLLTKKFIKK